MSSGGGAMAGGFFGAVGSLMSANEKSDAYQKQAEDLTRNAAISRKVGEFNVTRQQIIANRKIGGISADYAASGVASDSGSVLAVLQASHANSELDRLSILHGAELRSSMMEERAQTDRNAADKAIQIGYINAVSSMFGGSARAAEMQAPGDGMDSGGYDSMDTFGGTEKGYGSAGGGQDPAWFYGNSPVRHAQPTHDDKGYGYA